MRIPTDRLEWAISVAIAVLVLVAIGATVYVALQ